MKKGTFKNKPKTSQAIKKKAAKSQNESKNVKASKDVQDKIDESIKSGDEGSVHLKNGKDEVPAVDVRESSQESQSPSPDPEKPYILLIAMHVKGSMDTRYISLFNKIFGSGCSIHRATSPKPAFRCLEKPNKPKAILLLDHALAHEKTYARLACRVMEYVRGGGTLICLNIFGVGPTPPPSNNKQKGDRDERKYERLALPIFRLAGLPWAYGDQFCSSFIVNPKAVPANIRSKIPEIYLITRGILLDKVATTDAWYLQTPESVADAMAYDRKGIVYGEAPKPSAGDGTGVNPEGQKVEKSKTVGRATTEMTSIAYASVGEGRFGWVSDLESERQMVDVVMVMVGLCVDEANGHGKSVNGGGDSASQLSQENGVKSEAAGKT